MSIISVPQEPEDYRTVYNPIEYVAESDSIAEDRFKYLFDVYDGATQIARLKVPASPNVYGRADIHGICESYLFTNLGDINTTTTGIGFTDNDKSYKEFTVKIGEEYDNISGVLTQYPDQEIRTVIVFNGCLPNYRGNIVNFYDWQVTNYYENYTVNGTSRKWLTNSPKGTGANKSENQKVQLTDEGWLYFLYDHSSNPVTGVEFDFYDANGVLLNTERISNSLTTNMLKVPFAPNTINNILPGQFSAPVVQPIITNETSYSIVLKNLGAVVSEKFWFNIDSECRYETRRIEFLNSLGGFDCFNFTKVSRRSEEIERKFYKQNPDNLDSSTGVITYSQANRQKVQYYTKSKPKMKLVSDWVDVATFNWLLEMLESPEIYLYENGKRITVQNVEGNWEEKRSDTDSIFNLEVNLEFGVDNYRQRF